MKARRIPMEKLIAYCGFDCATCEARIATVTNNNELRSKLANEWKIKYNTPNFTPDMVDCVGCREAGVKNKRCELCEIRNCAISKNFQTCAECDTLESCAMVKKVHRYVPEALENLKSLNNLPPR
jgi:hypothetical protein